MSATYKVGDQVLTRHKDGQAMACTVQEVADDVLRLTVNAPEYELLVSPADCHPVDEVLK